MDTRLVDTHNMVRSWDRSKYYCATCNNNLHFINNRIIFLKRVLSETVLNDDITEKIISISIQELNETYTLDIFNHSLKHGKLL